jgi:hypothetical protein
MILKSVRRINGMIIVRRKPATSAQLRQNEQNYHGQVRGDSRRLPSAKKKAGGFSGF